VARKENRNNSGMPFKGIGKGKLSMLMSYGIRSARQLLHYPGGNSKILPGWKDTIDKYYKDIAAEVEALTARVEVLEDEIAQYDVILMGEEDDNCSSGSPARGNNGRQVQQQPSEKELPPPFSKVTDPEKYNARPVSKSTIDRVMATNFSYRKKLQEAKMRNIPASVLKIDWSYKLPPKVKVYTGRGDSFSPFKSHVVVQNEDSQCVFWKMYAGTESYGATGMKDDLIRLKQRFDHLRCDIRVIYVDNCCNVRKQLQSVFSTAQVKLDQFHWIKRWDDVLYDPRSAEAGIFRTSMRRAVFVIENHEFERVRHILSRKLRREPTTKEILKDAKATIPAPDDFKIRVEAVIRYMYLNDVTLDLQVMAVNAEASNDDSENKTSGETKGGRFLKRLNKDIKRLIQNQLKHVVKGCLSHPPASVVRLHRVNPRNNKTFTARSTGTCEADARQMNSLLNTPSVGIARAERVINDFYEQSNDRKRVSRLGEEQALTSRVERLLLLNSLAEGCGYKKGASSTECVCPTRTVLDGVHGSFVSASGRILCPRFDFSGG
jgi:hypothetical protein